MKRIAFLAAVLSGLLQGCGGFSAKPVARVELETPRPYGYLIGDEIRHRLKIETRGGFGLDTASLPAPGPVNRWLELNRVEFRQDGENTWVDLYYQTFYAGHEVKQLTIPGFTLQFNRDGDRQAKPVAPWVFTLSPITELAPRKDENGQPYTRPDVWPALLSTASQQWSVGAGLAGAGVLSAYLAYLYGCFPAWPKRRIFKRAARELAGLNRQQMARALAVMHHALNSLNGAPLFGHQMGEFFLRHPDYRDAADALEWFFAYSNQVLFGGRLSFTDADWRQLRACCKLCRQIEQGKR